MCRLGWVSEGACWSRHRFSLWFPGGCGKERQEGSDGMVDVVIVWGQQPVLDYVVASLSSCLSAKSGG